MEAIPDHPWTMVILKCTARNTLNRKEEAKIMPLSSDRNIALERTWKPPYVRWFEKDFWSSSRVRLLPPIARLMYRSLLQGAWDTEDPPYIQEKDMERLADAPDHKTWKTHKQSIIDLLDQAGDGRYVHRKMLALYQECIEYHEGRARGGRARQGRSSARAELHPSPSAAAFQQQLKASNHNQSHNQNHNQNQKEHCALSKVSEPVPEDSDEMVRRILEAYPKPDFSQAAESAVIEAIEREASKRRLLPYPEGAREKACDYLLSRTQAYASAVKRWPKGERGFTYSCVKFFEGSLYRQEDECWERPSDDYRPAPVESGSERLRREGRA